MKSLGHAETILGESGLGGGGEDAGSHEDDQQHEERGRSGQQRELLHGQL